MGLLNSLGSVLGLGDIAATLSDPDFQRRAENLLIAIEEIAPRLTRIEAKVDAIARYLAARDLPASNPRSGIDGAATVATPRSGPVMDDGAARADAGGDDAAHGTADTGSGANLSAHGGNGAVVPALRFGAGRGVSL